MPTVSPSGFLVTETARVSAPLVRVMEVRSSSFKDTSATVPMVAAPLAPESGSALMASRESTGLPICRDRVLPCSWTVPTGTRAPLFARASRMAVIPAPAAARSSCRGRISMCWVAPPVTSAPRTPSIFCSRGTLSRSRSALSSLRDLSEETARNTMGKSLMLPAMAWGWTSSGRDRLALEMALSIWFRARSRFEPYVNTRLIWDTPLREVEDVDSRPSTPFRAVSSGPLTCLSTTSGEAPGMAVSTVICGNSIDGMSSCFSDVMVSTPKTEAKTVISAIRARFASERCASRNIAWSPVGWGTGTDPAVPALTWGQRPAETPSSCSEDAVASSSSAASSGFSSSLTP